MSASAPTMPSYEPVNAFAPDVMWGAADDFAAIGSRGV